MKLVIMVGLVVLVVAPSPLAAQSWLAIPDCRGPFITCVVPIPPSGVPAWLAPAPVPPPVFQPLPPLPLPTYQVPLPTSQVPLYTPPVYVAPPRGGINPWIPLMAVPPPSGRSALETLLLWQQLAP